MFQNPPFCIKNTTLPFFSLTFFYDLHIILMKIGYDKAKHESFEMNQPKFDTANHCLKVESAPNNSPTMWSWYKMIHLL